MNTKSPLEAARAALAAYDTACAEPDNDPGYHARIDAAIDAVSVLRALIESDRPERTEMRVLTIPSAGVRIGTWEPRQTFEVLTELLATGYTFDEIEWEDGA